jgi:hypothetical protein
VELVVASAFMGHMAVDTGIFAPLSPISYWYTPLGPYRLPLAAGALLCAIAAGFVLKTHQVKGYGGGQRAVA